MFGFWLGLFLVLVFIEMATINLVSIWFAIGALASTFVALVTDSILIQTIVFVIISATALLLTKPFASRLRKRKIIPTNLDRIIGTIGIVTDEITPLTPGEVKVDGKRWSALAKQKIERDTEVEILSIEGVKVYVKPVKEEK